MGGPLIILINGVSYLISAFTELFITVPKTVHQGEEITLRGIFSDFGVAIRETLRNRYLRLFVPSALILNLLGAGPSSLMLPFTLEKGFTVEMYGYLISAETAASLLCVCLLGIVRLRPKARYWGMSGGFLGSILFYVLTYLTRNYAVMCIMMFLGSFANALGNSTFNASLMLALPEGNRGALLGFISAASTGGCALSAVIFGVLGDVFPLYLVFTVGCLLTILPMAYMSLHKNAREFVLTH